jgi:hypothetical protein
MCRRCASWVSIGGVQRWRSCGPRCYPRRDSRPFAEACAEAVVTEGYKQATEKLNAPRCSWPDRNSKMFVRTRDNAEAVKARGLLPSKVPVARGTEDQTPVLRASGMCWALPCCRGWRYAVAAPLSLACGGRIPPARACSSLRCRGDGLQPRRIGGLGRTPCTKGKAASWAPR